MAHQTIDRPVDAAVSPKAVSALQSAISGALLRPLDSGYDSARRVFNAMIDRRPALIARCARVADVIHGVNFARENGLALSIRGGGHSVAGDAVCDGGLMLDLSQLKAVQVDPVDRIARAQPGLTLGELDAATQGFGLATPLGVVSMTGIAGLRRRTAGFDRTRVRPARLFPATPAPGSPPRPGVSCSLGQRLPWDFEHH